MSQRVASCHDALFYALSPLHHFFAVDITNHLSEMQRMSVNFWCLFALSTNSIVACAFTISGFPENRPILRKTVALDEAAVLEEVDAATISEELVMNTIREKPFSVSSPFLYGLPTLWSDVVKPDATPNLESASVYSASDESSATATSCDRSLAAMLVSFVLNENQIRIFMLTAHVVTPSSVTITQNVQSPTASSLSPSRFRRRPLVVGHRGSLYEEPENTVASFQKSADLGCDAVELDVFLLKCGTLVVFHGDGNNENPGRLKDYCGLDGSILDYTAQEAKTLPFFPHANVYPCPLHQLETATIPTLEQVLENAKETGIIVKIELKGTGTEEPVLELVERMGMVNQCHFASFCHDRVARIRQLRPQRHANGTYVYKTACLFDGEVPHDFLHRASMVGASEVHLRYDTCTSERIEAIHKAGMGSMAWFSGPRAMRADAERFDDVGNEDSSMYEIVWNSGVQAMCVNRPDVLLSMFED